MAALDRSRGRDDRAHDHHPYTPAHGQGQDDAPVSRPPTAIPDTPRMHPPELAGYTLMVAGRRTGKTAFLRLLLDTSNVARTVTPDQLVSVAKFVQGCSGHTAHVRTVSIDVDLTPVQPGTLCTLSLIDTPSLDFDDDSASQRTLTEILRHVDARFTESIEDERKAQSGDHHVHLCIYFLDPDSIVPPSVSAPPVPLVPRARTNSLSIPEAEPVILDPPVTTNPFLCRPTLPAADITAIRRLSARVNVLPVVARADVLTNDRLAAVKLAIRRDLADAGIGFGIFDVDAFPQDSRPSKLGSESVKGYANHVNGSASAATTPPSTPISPSFLTLPFALISPDVYCHSDGVSRPAPSRQDIAQYYTPLQQISNLKTLPPSKMVPGKFVRSYRWGSLDVMDANHCDFVCLHTAIFHHMQTLQKYTREYLFQKFKAEIQPAVHHAISTRASQTATAPSRLPPLPHGSRPILAIDTTPSYQPPARPPTQMLSRPGIPLNGDVAPPPVVSPQPPAVAEPSPRTASSSRSQRSRAKKITVACNFCRSRKLKCDGGRPACGQCHKRSNPCDYMSAHKRRGNGKSRRQYGASESEGESLEEQSGEFESISQSPEVASQPPSRRNSSVSMLLTENLPPLGRSAIEKREDPQTVLPPIVQAASVPLPEGRPELPPITSLSAPSTARPREDPQTLTALKTEENHMTQQRRRTSNAASGKGRAVNHGSKIVACNVCRARKTRCDGAHPTCGSCSRRSLECNYVNDPQTSRARGRNSGATPSEASRPTSSSRSSPSTQLAFGGAPPAPTNGYTRRIDAVDRGMAEQSDQPMKKMRMGPEVGCATLAIASQVAP